MLFCFISFTSLLWAEREGVEKDLKRKKGVYGMAGCGLGAMAFGEEDTRNGQLGAVTTNNFGLNQLGAISTGTSRCDAKSSSSAYLQERRERFVRRNYEALKVEMAVGYGENVQALASIMECGATGDFIQMTKKNYEYLISKSPQEFIKRIQEKIRTVPQLMKSCKA